MFECLNNKIVVLDALEAVLKIDSMLSLFVLSFDLKSFFL